MIVVHKLLLGIIVVEAIILPRTVLEVLDVALLVHF